MLIKSDMFQIIPKVKLIMLMTDTEFAELIRNWLDQKDRTEVMKVQLEHFKELTKTNRSDLQLLVPVYLQELKGIIRAMWRIKPKKHFSYRHYYLHIITMRSKLNAMRSKIAFLMRQCRAFPNVVYIID